jgi:hypothetical protein
MLGYAENNLRTLTDDDEARRYYTGSLLLYFQQHKLLADDRRGQNRLCDFSLATPLMIVVGRTVTGGISDSRENTDVQKALRFFGKFIRNANNQSVADLEYLLRLTEHSKDKDGQFYRCFGAPLTNIMRRSYPASVAGSAERLFDDMMVTLFHKKPDDRSQQMMTLMHRTGSDWDEIQIELQSCENAPFGLIRVGKCSELCKIIREDTQNDYCQVRPESILMQDSLFSKLNKPDGDSITLLMGAKMFTMGWNCHRVSSIGLINVGKGEGAEIIQLFGRGIRLKGHKEWRMKRMRFVGNELAALGLGLSEEEEQAVTELEMLNIYAFNADYMMKFRKIIQEGEGLFQKKSLKVKTKLDEIPKELLVIMTKPGVPEFNRSGKLEDKNSRDHIHIRLDLRSSLSLAKGLRDGDMASDQIHEEKLATATSEDWKFPEEALAFFDYKLLLSEVRDYCNAKGFFNLSITEDDICVILSEQSKDKHYKIVVDQGKAPVFQNIGDLFTWQKWALDILMKYYVKLYNSLKCDWEEPYREYRPLREECEQNPQGEIAAMMTRDYEVFYGSTCEEEAEGLKTNRDSLYWAQQKSGDIVARDFLHHFINPLIFIGDEVKDMNVIPTALNEGEWNFLHDLELFLETNHKFFKNINVHILRNLSRGNGLYLHVDGNRFYPDFIMWFRYEGKQYITFIDPHGLVNEEKQFNSPKIQLALPEEELDESLKNKMRTIKQLEKDLQRHDVVLNSFILSPLKTNMSDLICRWQLQTSSVTKDDIARKFSHYHILFMKPDVSVPKNDNPFQFKTTKEGLFNQHGDLNYIAELFTKVLSK